VDWRPTYSPTPGKPILYVGADGGLFQGVENADQTPWIRYAGSAQGAASPGGGLPVVKVTDVDLSIGNIDPNSGPALPTPPPHAPPRQPARHGRPDRGYAPRPGHVDDRAPEVRRGVRAADHRVPALPRADRPGPAPEDHSGAGQVRQVHNQYDGQ